LKAQSPTNNMKNYLFILCFLSAPIFAQNTGFKLIRLDQFGYLPTSKKVAVIANPIVGFDADLSFTPSNTYEVRKVSDNLSVFSGTPTPWKNGTTHTQSGDKGWWFDFSAVTTPGEYYLYDVNNNVGSSVFKIDENVYKDALIQAVRTFFYQRLSFSKQPPFVPQKWSDTPAFDGPNQDNAARSRWAKTDASTARDLHGGWMDAGDQNKYTTFAEGVVQQLLEAYRRNPTAFTDDFNIPESGNGIPDLLDEVMYELDFLKRMQDATGTDGFFLKLGVDNFNTVSPLSSDTRPRYYLPECTSGTLSGAAMFAMAGNVLSANSNQTLQNYGADLTTRAEAAWARAKVTTTNFTVFESSCDDGDIKAGDADNDAKKQLESAIVAAIYLYQSTGNVIYKTFVESKYTQIDPISNTWWGPYQQHVQTALLRFSEMNDVNLDIKNAIRNQKKGMDYAFSIADYNSNTDLYRAYMPDAQHHWGSNLVRSNCGSLNMDFIEFNLNTNQSSQYREIAQEYVHWLHGTNALGIVQLSNMYDYGGDYCINEIYHSWFDNGTSFDNALTSPDGPPPGYVVGGPNKYFSYTQLTPPAGQPAQKSYLDFNDGWPQSSWEVSEPAIYYNAAYILLLSNFVTNGAVPTYEPNSQITELEDFTISPNPNNGTFLVQFKDAKVRTIRLLDINGKLIFGKQINDSQTILEIESLPAGVYSVGVDSNWKTVVKE
jgi:endoglucanase